MFTLASLVLLVSFAFEVKQKKSFCILLLLMLSMIFVSSSFYIAFYWSALIMFGFVTGYLFINARHKKALSPKMVTLAFLFLTITQLLFLTSAVNPDFYMGAHISQIIGFLVLFIALVQVKTK